MVQLRLAKELLSGNHIAAFGKPGSVGWPKKAVVVSMREQLDVLELVAERLEQAGIAYMVSGRERCAITDMFGIEASAAN